ncbi:MAG: protoporphyrinogen oxidase [Armatimonadetes bacterium]|nr:protoporphyrinogen oxidase [Armatimonadota bacterium]
MSERTARVLVVGGGITGLAATHRLLELSGERHVPLEARLLEAGSRLGGVIDTQRRDGFLLEGGPDCFLTEKPWAIDLCRRLGLEDQIIGTNNEHRRSFIAWQGRLHPVPEGFQLLAPARLGPFIASPLFSWGGKLRAALEPFVPPSTASDESLGAFVRRRLGAQVLERLAQPMVAGIYGADPEQLSLAATLPRFRQMEREYGSLYRAMRAARARMGNSRGVSGARYGLFATLRGGMQELVDALCTRLPEGTGITGARIQRLRYDPANGLWTASAAGESWSASALCLALPAHTAAALLADLDPRMAELAAAIPYTSAATVNLAYRRADVPHPLDGFGFVVPQREGRTILGCTFTSTKFAGRAPECHVLLRVFLGDRAEGLDDEALLAAVREELRIYLGVRQPPLFTTVARHPRAMPHYPVGHLERVAEIERRLERWPGLTLAGNAYHGIGIPYSVHTGEQAAKHIVELLCARTP